MIDKSPIPTIPFADFFETVVSDPNRIIVPMVLTKWESLPPTGISQTNYLTQRLSASRVTGNKSFIPTSLVSRKALAHDVDLNLSPLLISTKIHPDTLSGIISIRKRTKNETEISDLVEYVFSGLTFPNSLLISRDIFNLTLIVTHFELPNYISIRQDWPNSRGGGVLLLVRKEINFPITNSFTHITNNLQIDVVSITVHTLFGKTQITNIYAPPGGDIPLNKWLTIFENLPNQVNHIFCGDFNTHHAIVWWALKSPQNEWSSTQLSTETPPADIYTILLWLI